MSKSAVAYRPNEGGEGISSDGILNALAAAVVVLDADGIIVHVNSAGEQFLQGGAKYLIGKTLTRLLPNDNPVFSLIEQVRKESLAISEYGVDMESPRIGRHLVNLQAAPMPDDPDFIVLTLQHRSIADTIDRQLTHRGAARSVTAMAAMLAHEVKNPLSGIRGAAQLLEQNAKADDAGLTTLIRWWRSTPWGPARGRSCSTSRATRRCSPGRIAIPRSTWPASTPPSSGSWTTCAKR